MDLIDLHTHTSISDGSMRPAELVRHAKQKGLTAIAVTDHDTTGGLDEAILEGNRIGLEVVPGVEIGADYTSELHILGYFKNRDYTKIAPVLGDLRKKREERNPKIVARLNELGFKITMEEVLIMSSGGVTGRPHIAKLLIEKGYVSSMEEAFDKYLSSGRPAYFKKDKLKPEECIEEIEKAGGLPVLAHPVHLRMEDGTLDELLSRLCAAGLRGMEAIYVDNTEEQTVRLIASAKRHRLLVTGGSDFHGSYKPNIEIGTGKGNLQVPYELLEKMKALLCADD